MSFMPWRTLDYDDFLTSLHLINHCILFVQFCVVGVEFSEAGILQLEQEKAQVPKPGGQKQRVTAGYETIVRQLLRDKQGRADKLDG